MPTSSGEFRFLIQLIILHGNIWSNNSKNESNKCLVINDEIKIILLILKNFLN